MSLNPIRTGRESDTATLTQGKAFLDVLEMDIVKDP